MTDQLRQFLADMLDWEQAHASFDRAIAGLPASLRGKRPRSLPYSAWEIVEHIRIAQRDILDFSRDPGYKEDKKWPDDYWPKTPAPRSPKDWKDSIAQYHTDVDDFKQLIRDPSFDLFAKVPWGSGQTNIREIVLAFDHTAYHVGQIVLVRRLLGAWK
jgi:hypothetical protein